MIVLCSSDVLPHSVVVVLDRREDKNCDTGRFELAFKQVVKYGIILNFRNKTHNIEHVNKKGYFIQAIFR